MIDWLTSETGTYVFITALIALYVGFVAGILVNAYWIERDEEDDDGDDGGDMFPDYPPPDLDGLWNCRTNEEHNQRWEAGLRDCDCHSWV